MLKSVRHKVLYFVAAAAIVLMMLGAPSSVPTTFAGDCPNATGSC